MTGGLALPKQKLLAPKEISRPSKKILGYKKPVKNAYGRQAKPGYGKFPALPPGGKPQAPAR